MPRRDYPVLVTLAIIAPAHAEEFGPPTFPASGQSAPLEEPYATVRLGVNMRRLPRPPRLATSDAAVARTTAPNAGDAGSADTSYTFAAQTAIATSAASYLGFEIEVSPTEPSPGAPRFVAGIGGVLGLQLGTQSIQLGGELAAGARMFDEYGTDDSYGELVLEARARGALWLTSWLSVGAVLGASLLDRDEWMGGFYLGFHSWTYGEH